MPTSASFEAEAIRQLGQQLSEAEQRLQFAELKIQVLEERLREALIKKYGPSSEKLSSAQLELLELEPGVSSDEVQAESERELYRHRPKLRKSKRIASRAANILAARAFPRIFHGWKRS